MLISATALAEVGSWDESYLLYSEETEYSLRAADLGWVTWYEPAAVFEHIGGESTTSPMLASRRRANAPATRQPRLTRCGGSGGRGAVSASLTYYETGYFWEEEDPSYRVFVVRYGLTFSLVT